jgi:hypothetical protein
MRTQLQMAQSGAVAMQWGDTLRVERLAGEFAVVSGRVWVTRQGDLADHVIEAGERFVVRASDVAVVEPWAQGEQASLAWTPRAQRPRVEALPRDAAAGALRGLAAVAAFAAGALRRAEGFFEALARTAACRASRAQGCI